VCGNYFYVSSHCCIQFTHCYYYYIVVVVAAAAVIVFDVFVFSMATRLLDGRFGLRIPVGARDFPFSKTSGLVLWPTPISYCMNIGGFPPRHNGRSVKLIDRLHLAPRLTISGAKPLLPPTSVMENPKFYVLLTVHLDIDA
jgi:hypothetical protein